MSEIVIHLPNRAGLDLPNHEHLDPQLTEHGRTDLAMAVLSEGETVSFSRGKSAYDFEADYAVLLQPRFEQSGDRTYQVHVTPQTVALSAIGAIRNLHTYLHNGLPELNVPEVRKLALDKWQANALFAEVGVAKQFAELRAYDESSATTDTDPRKRIDAALDAIDSDQVVIKPRKGMQSQGIVFGSKSEVANMYANNDIANGEDWVVEERLHFRPWLPLRGEDDEQQAKLDIANRTGAAKELRTYSFGRVNNVPILDFVARVASSGDHLGNDDWVYIDPDSVPHEVIGQATQIFQAVENRTSAPEVHVVTDTVFAERYDGSVVTVQQEINASRPQLVRSYERPHVSSRMTTAMARQLIRLSHYTESKRAKG